MTVALLSRLCGCGGGAVRDGDPTEQAVGGRGWRMGWRRILGEAHVSVCVCRQGGRGTGDAPVGSHPHLYASKCPGWAVPLSNLLHQRPRTPRCLGGAPLNLLLGSVVPLSPITPAGGRD